ncbi:MAG: FkbM family methyltransferase [Candidatus Hinthialibacter antarcticus]|nr:FkbM family methyltransferase [Candidatus Hinthialibacter antarcticus]
MIQLLKQAIKSAVRLTGAELVQRRTAEEWNRQSMYEVLRQIQHIGVDIRSVIDVGAAQGVWSVMCAEVLSNSNYLLIEPLLEYDDMMKDSLKRIPNAKCLNVALSNEPGEKELHVHPDLFGSSFYLEQEDSDVNGVVRTVKVETLDSVCDANQLEPPYLLKIDVQGAELDVLESGLQVLQKTEFAIIETSFFRFYENGKTIVDLIEFMKSQGFAPYDIFGHQYRPLDGALAQIDLCFVKDDSDFRKYHHYATAQQREQQNKRLRSLNR